MRKLERCRKCRQVFPNYTITAGLCETCNKGNLKSPNVTKEVIKPIKPTKSEKKKQSKEEKEAIKKLNKVKKLQAQLAILKGEL